MYALAVTHAGYRARTATDAVAALRQIRADPPDAVVTDLSVPGMQNGWELIRSVKELASTTHVPIVLLTGHVETEIADTARLAGCAAVLTKPCLPNELVQVLQRLWSDGTTAA